MCEQTEISYLDGDVVWVKLGACWWPGQVTGFHNLPEDIQLEFKKKPLIAAVKFFQEDTFEFVKNYQQIYKYNCTLKEDFIKKGLDKYRSKSKDGTSYMDKFPGDVEMAENLTGGDPKILSSRKFGREEKPDISGLFGEKKIPKKKRNREDSSRDRSSNAADSMRRITHPRFLKESDHEIRIRQQPSSSLPSTPNNSTSSPQYTCYVCNFTSSRLNVIILHNKTHSSGNITPVRAKVKTYSQPRARTTDLETPKRKYVRKDKSEGNRSKNEGASESPKRKYTKQTDKPNKKKKPDPELREKLLADWDDEYDEEGSMDLTSPTKYPDISASAEQSKGETDEISEENDKILEEAEKLLNETEKLTTIDLTGDSLGISSSKSVDKTGSDRDKKKSGFSSEKNSIPDKGKRITGFGRGEAKSAKHGKNSESGKKSSSEADDKKSRLSCFDFDEDDLAEPTIPPVRKIPRVFGDKNLSLKKEIIKEFEMSQALKNEQQRSMNNDKDVGAIDEQKVSEGETKQKEDFEIEEYSESMDPENVEKKASNEDKASGTEEEAAKYIVESKDDQDEKAVKIRDTEVEIVEIFEVEKGESNVDEISSYLAGKPSVSEDEIITEMQYEIEEGPQETAETNRQNVVMEIEEIVSEEIPINTEETVISNEQMATEEPVAENISMETAGTVLESVDIPVVEVAETHIYSSEMKDVEKTTTVTSEKIPQIAKKHRGRPRKNQLADQKSFDSSIPDVKSKASETEEKLSEIEDKSLMSDVPPESAAKPVEDKNMSNTDQSLAARIRKPDRRSEQRSAKSEQKLSETEASQSDSEDIPLYLRGVTAEVETKSRRGRRSLGFKKIIQKSLELDTEALELQEEPTESVDVSEKSLKTEEKFETVEKKSIRGLRLSGHNKRSVKSVKSSLSESVENQSDGTKIESSESQKELSESVDTSEKTLVKEEEYQTSEKKSDRGKKLFGYNKKSDEIAEQSSSSEMRASEFIEKPSELTEIESWESHKEPAESLESHEKTLKTEEKYRKSEKKFGRGKKLSAYDRKSDATAEKSSSSETKVSESIEKLSGWTEIKPSESHKEILSAGSDENVLKTEEKYQTLKKKSGRGKKHSGYNKKSDETPSESVVSESMEKLGDWKEIKPSDSQKEPSESTESDEKTLKVEEKYPTHEKKLGKSKKLFDYNKKSDETAEKSSSSEMKVSESVEKLSDWTEIKPLDSRNEPTESVDTDGKTSKTDEKYQKSEKKSGRGKKLLGYNTKFDETAEKSSSSEVEVSESIEKPSNWTEVKTLESHKELSESLDSDEKRSKTTMKYLVVHKKSTRGKRLSQHDKRSVETVEKPLTSKTKMSESSKESMDFTEVKSLKSHEEPSGFVDGREKTLKTEEKFQTSEKKSGRGKKILPSTEMEVSESMEKSTGWTEIKSLESGDSTKETLQTEEKHQTPEKKSSRVKKMSGYSNRSADKSFSSESKVPELKEKRIDWTELKSLQSHDEPFESIESTENISKTEEQYKTPDKSNAKKLSRHSKRSIETAVKSSPSQSKLYEFIENSSDWTEMKSSDLHAEPSEFEAGNEKALKKEESQMSERKLGRSNRIYGHFKRSVKTAKIPSSSETKESESIEKLSGWTEVESESGDKTFPTEEKKSFRGKKLVGQIKSSAETAEKPSSSEYKVSESIGIPNDWIQIKSLDSFEESSEPIDSIEKTVTEEKYETPEKKSGRVKKLSGHSKKSDETVEMSSPSDMKVSESIEKPSDWTEIKSSKFHEKPSDSVYETTCQTEEIYQTPEKKSGRGKKLSGHNKRPAETLVNLISSESKVSEYSGRPSEWTEIKSLQLQEERLEPAEHSEKRMKIEERYQTPEKKTGRGKKLSGHYKRSVETAEKSSVSEFVEKSKVWTDFCPSVPSHIIDESKLVDSDTKLSGTVDKVSKADHVLLEADLIPQIETTEMQDVIVHTTKSDDMQPEPEEKMFENDAVEYAELAMDGHIEKKEEDVNKMEEPIMKIEEAIVREEVVGEQEEAMEMKEESIETKQLLESKEATEKEVAAVEKTKEATERNVAEMENQEEPAVKEIEATVEKEEVIEQEVTLMEKSEVEAMERNEGVTETEVESTQKNEEVTEQKEEVIENEEQISTVTETTAATQPPQISKFAVQMLPPKKSQIRTFDLSEMNFFDRYTSVEKTCVQPEFEEKKDALKNMEIEITRVDPNGEISCTLPENVVEEERADRIDESTFSDSLAEQIETEVVTEEITIEQNLDEQPEMTIERGFSGDLDQQGEERPLDKTDKLSRVTDTKKKQSKNELEIELVTKDLPKSLIETPVKRTAMQTRYKGKFTPETGVKPKRDKDLLAEDKPINTFQEAFLKTLQIDNLKRDKKMVIDEIEITVGRGKKCKKLVKKKIDGDIDNVNIVPVPQDVNIGRLQPTESTITKPAETMSACERIHDIQEPGCIPSMSSMSDFQGVEVVVEENSHSESKLEDTVYQATSETEAKHLLSPSIAETSKALTLDLPKLDETSRMSMSTPSPNSDIGVPVKKREKPRIIENVTLKEPMHILKSKLLEKIPPKVIKHKLEPDSSRKGDSKHIHRAKVMKIDPSASPATKLRQTLKMPAYGTVSQKLEALKNEDLAIAGDMEARGEKAIPQSSQALSPAPITEKLIQQSSQSLADMELDINSMPFVLSEDVLTPESIEQMPVVLTSIIPSSSSVATKSIAMTATTQMAASSPTQYKPASDQSTESPLAKKKTGMPAILKTKGKGKPTITSIKTIAPPLTGGVKGLKFQNTQTGKTSPFISHKGQPGKYVIVQTSGGQQVRYSVQGKPGTQQTLAVSAGKSPGSAQIVQQGGKVVILTSPQSGQTKMIPLNATKGLTGKVQRIMTSKGQVFAPISPQGLITTKTVIAPKTDASTPTTSKVTAQGQKVINTQGIITSKGMLTPIPGTMTKSALLSTLSQGILTKGGLYTPISASPLTGKTLIGSKTLVTTTKGTTILSPLSSQNLVTSKAILAPLTQTIGGKTILGAQTMVTSKGTVLTPITGQQVKAIAAKSPSKGGKLQYQAVQQKVQLLQKNQKIPISSSQMRVFNTLKSPGSTILLQNTVTGQKTLLHGKKIMKQPIAQQGQAIPYLSLHTPSQQISQPAGASSQSQQKGKLVSTTATVQKVVIPKASGRHGKSQPKIVVQKIHESGSPSSTSPKTIANMPPLARTSHHKHSSGSATSMKASGKNYKTAQRRNILNAALNSISTPPLSSISKPLALPALEPIDPEKKMKLEEVTEEMIVKEDPKPEPSSIEQSETSAEKSDEPKVATSQPQIMALPTESGDGTQTYVLVTIDDQGQIQPLDNNTLMSLEGTTQNPDGTRTLYIDPSSLGEAGTLDNIVLQFDNGSMSNSQSNAGESSQAMISESFPASEIIQTSNQDILAAALANTDFQQEIGLPETPAGSVMPAGLTQTSLINQTILQSTIIPPTEPISSPAVLETSLTLNQPIMTPLEVPSNLPIQTSLPSTSVVSTIASSLELPLTITNPNIAYISAANAHLQIPGNSMPDIGEIMASPAEVAQTETPVTTQYLVIPSLDENITIQSASESMPTVSYAVSIPDSMVLDSSQVQTTPSMPIIDDTYAEDIPYSTTIETGDQSYADVPVSEMLVSKASIVPTEDSAPRDVTVTSEMIVTSHEIPATSQEMIIMPVDTTDAVQEVCVSSQDIYTSQEVPVTAEELILQQSTMSTQEVISTEEIPVVSQDEVIIDNHEMQVSEHCAEVTATSMPIIEESCTVTSESNVEIQSTDRSNFTVTDSSEIQASTSYEAKSAEALEETVTSEISCTEVAASSNQEDQSRIPALESLDNTEVESMEMEPPVETEIFTTEKVEPLRADEPSSLGESSREQTVENIEEAVAETSQEAPSQSYEQFDIAMADESSAPCGSVHKSEDSREPSQSVSYEPMEVDENDVSGEPPTQSFEDSKQNEASQSYETLAEIHGNAPTQSFNEIMQSQEDRTSGEEVVDDQIFPTQSYEVGKMESLSENMETDAEISQEGNIPSQSNDIATDGIGTSSVSTNNSGGNEDETASSSYVPETPETQERDQDQESAISTSSYEIPPCEELNIASSSEIPDTSVRAEHTSIHDNGVPEIPTSSYNLNPDSSSAHVDAVPTSSYEDQVILEQNVSTSYEVPISMPGLEETSSQNFVTESSDHRNEPSSYYSHHHEVTASYYEPVHQESNSRLEADAQQEVTASFYEATPRGIASEASQSYFAPEEATPSYSSQSVTPSFYDPRPESEATQSYYSSQSLDRTEQSASQNVEASQSYYHDVTDNLRLRQQGEATPTYSTRYPVDYTLANSPIERHDLVESSVPATRPTERAEHKSIRDNGVPEITTSYNLNLDSSPAHVPSRYEDPEILEQNVSTSCGPPVSRPELKETPTPRSSW